jgi:hypothetical protein
MRDPEGRKRIVMNVPPTGSATQKFYDEEGEKRRLMDNEWRRDLVVVLSSTSRLSLVPLGC